MEKSESEEKNFSPENSTSKTENNKEIKFSKPPKNEYFNNVLQSNCVNYIPLSNFVNFNMKNNFQRPPLIGLKNIGATCYMNATLQCLSQIERLTKFIKSDPHLEQVIKNKSDSLTKSYKKVIDILWQSNSNQELAKNSNNYYYIPNDFKNKISSMNPLFARFQANDAKYLLQFIIMTLHEELNKIEKNKNDANSSFYSNKSMDQSNEQEVLNNFVKDFAKYNRSIISDHIFHIVKIFQMIY